MYNNLLDQLAIVIVLQFVAFTHILVEQQLRVHLRIRRGQGDKVSHHVDGKASQFVALVIERGVEHGLEDAEQ